MDGRRRGALFLQSLPRVGEDCVIWPYRRNKFGTAVIRSNGRELVAARVVCEQIHGSPPDGMETAHSCGKAHLGCIAPWHLGWKTKKENEADKLIHGTHRRGEEHPRAKLSDQDIADIRVLTKSVVKGDVARHYKISRRLVEMIVDGKHR
jgi:hypothetical protein